MMRELTLQPCHSMTAIGHTVLIRSTNAITLVSPVNTVWVGWTSLAQQGSCFYSVKCWLCYPMKYSVWKRYLVNAILCSVVGSTFASVGNSCRA